MPKTGRIYTERVQVHLKHSQYTTLAAAARSCGIGVATLAREALVEGIEAAAKKIEYERETADRVSQRRKEALERIASDAGRVESH